MNFELSNSSQQLRLKKLIINPEDAKPKENDAEAENEEETTPTVVDLSATVETPSLEILARQNIKFVVRNRTTAYNPTILVTTNDNFVWGASGACGTANPSGGDNTSGATNSSDTSSNWWEIDRPEIPNIDTNVDFSSIEQLKSYVLNGNARNDFEAKFNDVPYNIGEAALLITKHENDFSSLTKDQFLNELHEILINKNVSEMTEDEIKNKVENLSKNINDLFTKLKNGEKIDDQVYEEIYNDIVKLKDKDLSNVGEFHLQYFELQKLISQFNHEFANQNLNEEQSISLLKNSLTKLAQQENFDGRMSSAIFELPNVFNNILLDSIIENIPEDKVYTANEFDSYLSSMNDTISANLKNKGFSDEQIELILELAKKNATPKSNNRFGFNNTSTQAESLKSVIQNYVDNIEQLTNPANFKLIIPSRYEQVDVWQSGVSSNGILAQLSMYINSDNIQLQYFGTILKNAIEDLNLTDNQAAAFIQKFIDNIIKSAGLDHWTTANSIPHRGYNGADVSTMSESSKAFSSRYDFIENYLSNDVINALGDNPLAKLSQILNNTMADIKVVDNNATTIDIDLLFGNEQELSADYILENLDSLLLSNDGGVRQFAEIITNKLSEKDYTISEKKSIIELIFKFINKEEGIDSRTLSKENMLKSYNSEFLFLVNEIINTDTFNRAYTLNVNGEFDSFANQGKTGDCWLLAGLNALCATWAGQQAFKNSISIADDYSSVTVTFAISDKNGNPISYTFTYEEIIAMDNFNSSIEDGLGYSGGDNDVLIMEMAVERFRRDLAQGNLSVESPGDPRIYLLCNAVGYGNNRDSMEPGEGIWGGYQEQLLWLLTGNAACMGDSNLTSKDIISLLRGMKDHVGTSWQEYRYSPYAAYFSLPASYTSAYLTDGTLFEFGGDNGSGHAFAIVGITENEVSFINPWNSETIYTMTWEEFSKLNITHMGATKINI